MFLCFHPLVLSYILIMALTTRSMTYLRNHLILFSLPILLLCIVVIPHCRASNHGCLEEASPFVDNNKNTLISQGEVFELGFFTPDHDNSTSRYLGIWYYNQSNPKIIVWVANRDKPLLKRNGSLVIRDGIAKVLDAESKIYWSTGTDLSTAGLQEHPVRPHKPKQNNFMPNLVRLCLEDNGNLRLHKREQGDQILWQSFHNPTDTFLPGMDAAGGSLNLTSWKAPNNPAKGSYVFTVQPDSGNQLLISRTGSAHYWESRITQFDPTPQPLLPLLLKNETQLKDYYNNTRLVMKFTGQLQFWRRDFERGYWSSIWLEPKDECGLYEACGSLGSCNSNNGWLCKCLPGTNANSPERWNVRDFSHGCSPKLEACHRNYLEDVFLRLPMMRVKAPKTNDTNVEDCETTCRTDCTCLAYSCGVTDCSSNEKTCLTWSSYDLTDLQEEYPKGVTIFVRTNRSDIEKTSRDCKPCGTYIIPYPLSTAANCGDSAYFNFRCNATTGQVYFSPSNLTYKVTLIDPDAKRFTIQVGLGKSCDSKYTDLVALLRKDSLQYDLQKCKAVKDQSSLEGERYFTEVDIAWKPPPEPTCSGSSGCRDWHHTSCKSGVGGKMRCRCGSRYHWDSENLRCTEVVSLKVVLPCVAGALAIVLLCGIFYTYYTWKRRLETQKRSAEFKGNVTEGIDVPFYDWEILLAATNNFADVNKLGMGGFGSVYRGKLPDGQEIAVKRLSKVSVQGLEEFRTEVELIAKLQHRNLVRLLGYCTTADERILVYEYLPNGSLDSCLFDEKHSVKLDWEKRFNIILSIARGLLYLHQDSRLRIIHRDLKPSNILLDEELNPKISDFGIARIVGGKETEATTGRVVGTYGYMSPEYAYEGTFSIKSDVFSFGVVILETISGRRNSRIFMLEHGLSLLGYAWKLWNEDKGLELMDPKLTETCFPSEVLKCFHIGLLCVQEDPSDRPTMSTVVYMLSGEDASLPLAKQPAFMNRKPLLEDNASSSSAKDSSVHEAMTVSTVGR